MSSLFGIQQQLTHSLVKSSILPLRKMPVFQGVAPWHTNFPLFCVSLFETQYQLTHPPVKNSTLLFMKIPVFQGAASWHTNFTLSSVRETQNQLTHPPVKSLTLPLRALHLGILIFIYSPSSLFENQHQLTRLPVKSSTLSFRNISVSQGVLLDIFSYYPPFGSLWFGAHPYYPLIVYSFIY